MSHLHHLVAKEEEALYSMNGLQRLRLKASLSLRPLNDFESLLFRVEVACHAAAGEGPKLDKELVAERDKNVQHNRWSSSRVWVHRGVVANRWHDALS
jgi:hypothetical protein